MEYLSDSHHPSIKNGYVHVEGMSSCLQCFLLARLWSHDVNVLVRNSMVIIFLSDIWFNYCFDNEIKCWTWLYFNMIGLPKYVCFNKNGIMTCIPWKCWSHFVTKRKFLQNFSKKKIANKEKKNYNIFFWVNEFSLIHSFSNIGN